MKLQIKIDGKTYEAEVEVLDEEVNRPDYAPYVPPPPTSQALPTARTYTSSQATNANATDEKQYRSPVTGLVIRVEVKPGQAVQPNDVIMVLEAMKMETSITARHAGNVKSVNVAPGDPAKLHQVLLELD